MQIEKLSWQLPYGRHTEAIVLKPQDAKGPLPGILGFHDHGGNKYFGRRKITRTSDDRLPLIETHQQNYYDGFAWANEIAKRGVCGTGTGCLSVCQSKDVVEKCSGAYAGRPG